MGKRQKGSLSFLCLFCLSVLFFSVTEANAKDRKLKSKDKTNAVNWQKALQSVDADADSHFLQRWLSFAQVKDAKEFWDGVIFERKGNAGEAKAHFENVRQGTWFRDYATLKLAQIFLQEKNYLQAQSLLQDALPKTNLLSKKIHWDLFWLKMEVLAHLRQGASLRNELKWIPAKQSKERWQILRREFALGYADLLAGDTPQAMQHFTTVLARYPGSDYDVRILQLAEDHHIKQSQILPQHLMMLRAENLLQIGLADWGYAIYEKLSDWPEDHLELKALALFRARRYVEASALFEALLRQGSTQMGRLALLIRLSQCYTRTDNTDKAIAMHASIMQEFPTSSNAAQAPYNIALLNFDAKNFATALRLFDDLLTRTPTTLSGKQKQQVLWYRFWSYYLSQNFAEAINAAKLALAEMRGDGEARQAILYFLARAYEQNNQSSLAKEQYQELQTGDENDYYALLARQRLRYGNLYPYRLLHPDLLQSVPQVENQEFAGKVNPSIFKTYDGLGVAFVLSQLNLDAYAYDELQNLEGLAKTNSDVALALPSLGNSRLSYAAGYTAKSGRLAGCDVECAYYLRFPPAYQNYVQPFAQVWHLNASLAYAIMRQESAFAPNVVSEAYAYGLMQIIPPTGEEIAQAIGYADFHPQDLMDAKVNVLFGTKYLKMLSENFSGDLIPTIASYNAGPYNLKRWLARSAHNDWDEFVELIPYTETKNYVKRVLVNFWIYERLYP